MPTLDEMTARTAAPLRRVVEIRNRIRDVHPFLETLYPIAIVEEGVFFIFEPGPQGYALAASAPTPMPVPQGVRAAFPLEAIDARPACVVTGEVFDTLPGYVEIFHEFIHCQQMDRGEQALKETLSLARQAQAENDMMWEIAYAFPYADVTFIDAYEAILAALARGDLETARVQRAALHEELTTHDWEYLVWQEWKEGFARYVENSIRRKLDLAPNVNGRRQPFNRVSFYAGGAAWVEVLAAQDPTLLTDLEALFVTLERGFAHLGRD
jgi:hypothetical protein